MPSVLQSKLRPDAIPRFAVERARLRRRLDAATRGRMTLVAAPPGHGKSVLLAQWARTRPEHLAWLTVDARDRDPARFARHLVAALARGGVDVGPDVAGLLSPASAALGGAFVDVVIDAVDASDHDMVVVLEDLDRIEGSPILGDVERLITETPSHAHFVVACRADPSIALHRLRVRGELSELRIDDLRFTETEATHVLAGLGRRDLTADQVALLVTRTEGWPVAVQLAALSLRSADDADAFIEQFAGDDRNVADFLSSEVLSNETDAVRGFLLDISVLDEIRPDLCDAILGRNDSDDMLRRLEHRGLFLTRADAAARGYRCHRLVREFLRHDLGQIDPDRAHALRIAAASWCIEHDDVLRAADYLIDAAAWDALERLVWSHARELWEAGSAETVLGWIDSMPPGVLRGNVRLRLGRAALCTIVGRAPIARAEIDELEHEPGLTRGEQLVADGIVAGLIELTETARDVIERVERALAALPTTPASEIPDVFGASGPESLQCLLSFHGARAQLLLGHAGAAFEMARRAVVSPGAAGAHWHVHALGTLALLDAMSGRLNRAESGARRALETAAAQLGYDHAATITPLLALGIVARHRNDLDHARALVDDALERARRWRRWPWVGLAHAELAALHLASGRPTEALEVVRAFAPLPAPPAAPFIAGRLRAAEARALDALDDHELAERLLPDVVAMADNVDVATTRLLFASAREDAALVRKELDAWPVSTSPIGTLEHDLWRAIAASIDGDRHAAIEISLDVAARAEREGHVRLFLDAGPVGIRLARELARMRPTRYAHALVDAAALRPTARTAPVLVEQLSERERNVLRYLPLRQTYAEIARDMYISPNTLKTHVRHICQKLGVSGRDAAVARAEALDLL